MLLMSTVAMGCKLSGLSRTFQSSCPCVVLFQIDSGLVHVTSLGLWYINKCDESGSILHICTVELVLWKHESASTAKQSQSIWRGHMQYTAKKSTEAF